MKRTALRICVFLTAAALIASLALLCSCDGKQVFPNEPITLPLERTYTLSYWLNFDNSYMPDYASFNDHPYFKWLEEQTNIHIDFDVPTSTASSKSELIGMLRGEWMTRIASGTMTDMVEHYFFVPDIEGGIDNAEDEELYYVLNEYIDVRSFVKWYIVEEFMNNTDSSMHSSVFMYKDAGGKFTLGPTWDFDRSSGNCSSGCTNCNIFTKFCQVPSCSVCSRIERIITSAFYCSESCSACYSFCGIKC